MKNIVWFFPLTFLLAPRYLFTQDFNVQLRSTLEYPGQSVTGVWGYTQNGREYALAGTSGGLSIVDVTNPDNIVQIVKIPTTNIQTIGEVKVYGHYAFIGSWQGVQIVDLINLPSPVLNYHLYEPTGYVSIHTLQVDTTKGFLYLFGSEGASIYDLNADPYNPVYAGEVNQLGYIHDGYVDNDTLYACQVYHGLLTILDMQDKLNPKILGSVETPGRLTHNSWILSDRQHILTTDEQTPSFVTAYNIADPTDIKELDRFSIDNGNKSIVHNTYVVNDWAVTAWYTHGFAIIDAHKPDNLVLVGQYDNWPWPEKGFIGCWDVYPYLPSGNILASSTGSVAHPNGKLYVCTPTYKRASYLSGQIIDGCSGQNLAGAEILLSGLDSLISILSDKNGQVKTGLPESGNIVVTISKPGYKTQSLSLVLSSGEEATFNVTLERVVPSYNITGTVVDQLTGTPIAYANLALKTTFSTYTIQTNTAGQFNMDCMFGGNYRVGAWGYLVQDLAINNNNALNISLQPSNYYYDDFELNLGWVPSGLSNTGKWVLDEPIGTYTSNGIMINPELDVDSDNGDQCYITGNSGGSILEDQVHRPSVILTSPLLKLSNSNNPVLSFYYWYMSDIPSGTTDGLFEVIAANGQQTVSVFKQKSASSQWRYSGKIYLKDYLPLTDNMEIQFIATQNGLSYALEAAVDVFQITEGLVSAIESEPTAHLLLSPNPSTSDFNLDYFWLNKENISLEVHNQFGQLILAQPLIGNNRQVNFGTDLPRGIYLIRLRADGKESIVLKAIKL